MKQLQRIKQTVGYILVVMYIVMAEGVSSRAASLKDSIYVTGTKQLAADALVAIQIVAAVIAVALVGWNLFCMKLGEENEESRYKKRAITTVIVTIIIETIGTLFGIIGGYYGVKFS